MKQFVRKPKSLVWLAQLLVIAMAISIAPLATLKVSADDNLSILESESLEELEEAGAQLPLTPQKVGENPDTDEGHLIDGLQSSNLAGQEMSGDPLALLEVLQTGEAEPKGLDESGLSAGSRLADRDTDQATLTKNRRQEDEGPGDPDDQPGLQASGQGRISDADMIEETKTLQINDPPRLPDGGRINLATGQVEIRKVVQGEDDPDQSFTFIVRLGSMTNILEQASQEPSDLLEGGLRIAQGDDQGPTLTSSTNTDLEKLLDQAGKDPRQPDDKKILNNPIILKDGEAEFVEVNESQEINAGTTLIINEVNPEGYEVSIAVAYEDIDRNKSDESNADKLNPINSSGPSIEVGVYKDVKTIVTFTNKKIQPGTVTISKQVTGDGADPSQRFDFILDWWMEDSGSIQESTRLQANDLEALEIEGRRPDNLQQSQSLLDQANSGDPDSQPLSSGLRINGDGRDSSSFGDSLTRIDQLERNPGGDSSKLGDSIEFTLAHGETKSYDLPQGAEFRLIEVDDRHLVSITMNGQAVDSIDEVLVVGGVTAIVFTNEINKPAPGQGNENGPGPSNQGVEEDTTKKSQGESGTLVLASQSEGMPELDPVPLVAGDQDTKIPATGAGMTFILPGLLMLLIGMAIALTGRKLLKKEVE